jgi:DNA polymerase Ligase (LigD)
MPRFAVLAHDHPTPHWDLFLEAGPVLRSWRLPPGLLFGTPVPAEPAADHRLAYLDYEGPVSGDRGTVTRVDAGTFAWVRDEPDTLVVRLAAASIAGVLTLSRTAGGWTARLDPG